MLEAMSALGVPPDTRAYNLLLKHHARAGDVGAAQALFKTMRTYGLPLTVVTYNTLMQVRQRHIYPGCWPVSLTCPLCMARQGQS